MEEIMAKRFLVGADAVLLAIGIALTSIWFCLQPPALPVPAQTSFVVKDITLINPGLGRQDHVDTAIERGMIRAVTKATNEIAANDLHCPGCFALPGPIDMHAHMPPRAAIGNDQLFALLYLANGVTMIREVGSSDGNTYSIRDAIAGGDYPGPRMMSCGLILDGDPPTRPNNFIVRTPADGRAAIADAVAHGARCLKMYNMLSRDAVLAIADAAAAAHLRIVAHTPHSVSLLDAPYIADVQHSTGVPETSDVEKLGATITSTTTSPIFPTRELRPLSQRPWRSIRSTRRRSSTKTIAARSRMRSDFRPIHRSRSCRTSGPSSGAGSGLRRMTGLHVKRFTKAFGRASVRCSKRCSMHTRPSMPVPIR
jgi:hypothetical protein